MANPDQEDPGNGRMDRESFVENDLGTQGRHGCFVHQDSATVLRCLLA
jgi:hypothetical protein